MEGNLNWTWNHTNSKAIQFFSPTGSKKDVGDNILTPCNGIFRRVWSGSKIDVAWRF